MLFLLVNTLLQVALLVLNDLSMKCVRMNRKSPVGVVSPLKKRESKVQTKRKEFIDHREDTFLGLKHGVAQDPQD